jgi:hypothetical protein
MFGTKPHPSFDIRAFAVNEWEFCHTMLDLEKIPRTDVDGSQMSLSHRLSRLFAKHNLGGLHAASHDTARRG